MNEYYIESIIFKPLYKYCKKFFISNFYRKLVVFNSFFKLFILYLDFSSISIARESTS